MAWTKIVGVLVGLYGVYVMFRGRVIAGEDGDTQLITRHDNPGRFWLFVAGMFLLAVLLFINPMHW